MLSITGLTTNDLADAARNSWLWKMNGDTYGWVHWDDDYSGSGQQALRFEDQGDDLYLDLPDSTWPRFQGMQWHADFDYDGPSLVVNVRNNFVDITVTQQKNYMSVSTGWSSIPDDMGYREDILNGTYPYFRITRNQWPDGCQGMPTGGRDRIEVQASTNGTTWVGFGQDFSTQPVTPVPTNNWWENGAATGYPILDFDDGGPWSLHVTVGGMMDILDVKGATVSAHVCPDAPTHTPPPAVPDPYCPTCNVPAATQSCITKLQAIRDYSLAVRAAVRIIGPNQIELVDPNEDLPSGFEMEDASDLYVSDEETYKGYVGTTNLVDVTLKASMANNDDRLLASDFRIPQRLPLEQYGATPVIKYEFNITPTGMTTDLEFFQQPELIADPYADEE